MRIVLFRPEIPPNTGNVMRLSANTGSDLHLIHPLGFDLDEAKLRRAGLDYREWATVHEHDSFDAFLDATGHPRVLAFTRNGSETHTEVEWRAADALLFGPESDGLPDEVLAHEGIHATVRIPMHPRSRSLNLANSVAIGVYEALRQQGFPDLSR